MSSPGKFKMNDGDWVCSDPQCGNVNFARRTTCNRCGKAVSLSVDKSETAFNVSSDNEDQKSSTPHRKKLGHEIGKAAAEKSRGLFSADDWQCGRCSNVNWARRQQCNMCNAPKFGEVEERTGLGGGYNERENIEYIDREESDGEYDDFGRKKKKFRGSIEEENLEKSKLKIIEEVKKEILKQPIKDVEDDEEDEDEEDDDADLSKYDLSGWGDDSSPKENKKGHSPSRHSSGSSKSSENSRSRSRSSSRSSVSSQSSRSSSGSSSASDRPGKNKRKHSRSRSSSSSSKGNSKRHRSGSSGSSSVSRERDRSRSNSPVNHRR